MGKNKQHLSHKYFIRIIRDAEAESRAANHLKVCSTCDQILTLLKRIEAIAGDEEFIPEESSFSMEAISTLIPKVYNGSISKEDATLFLSLLIHSPYCFEQTLGLVKDALLPAHKRIENDMQSYSDLSTAEKVLKMVPPGSRKSWFNRFIRPWINRFKEQISMTFGSVLKPAPAWAFTIIILAYGGFTGLQYYRIDYRINKAASLLADSQTTYFGTPQLSGHYRMSAQGTVLTGSASSSKPLDKSLIDAHQLVLGALSHSAESQQAQLILSDIYLLNKDYRQADSLLKTITQEDEKSAAAFNNLGVSRYSEQEWQLARNYFQLAIRADSTFAVAHFNLALVDDKMGDRSAALSHIRQYLQLEKNEGWRNAAHRLKQKLE